MTRKAASLDELKSRYESMIGFTPPKIAKRLELGMRVDRKRSGEALQVVCAQTWEHR